MTFLGAARSLRQRRERRRGPGFDWVPYLFVAPALAIFILFAVVPIVHSIVISLFEWDGLTEPKWVGLRNYATLVTNRQLRETFLHPITLFLFYSLIPIGLGLLLASVLSSARIRFFTTYRAILFLPYVAPSILVAISWRYMYALDGPINEVLRMLGLGAIARAWLGDFTFALPAVGFVGSWVAFGFVMVLFIVGIQKIPTSLYEAARVDGAGRLHEFWHVTLPGLRSELVIALVLSTTSSLQSFTLVFLLTRGGPGNATNVPAYAIYRAGFVLGEAGLAAAAGVILTLSVVGLVWAITRLDRADR